MRTNNQNVNFVLITINKLKNTLNWVTQKIQNIQNDTNTFNEFENAMQIKQLNREIRKYKKNNNKILSTNNTNKIETTMINNATMDSTKKDENNKYENLDKLSDISILQLDNKIEGLDTERLIDLNIIDASNIEENSVFLNKKKEDNKYSKKRAFLQKIKIKNNNL
jgi:hypothetical protein